MAFLLVGKFADKLITKNVANIIDINNSYYLLIAKRNRLKTTLGFNYFTNEYSKNRFPEELSLFYNDASHDQGNYSNLGRFKGSRNLLPHVQ